MPSIYILNVGEHRTYQPFLCIIVSLCNLKKLLVSRRATHQLNSLKHKWHDIGAWPQTCWTTLSWRNAAQQILLHPHCSIWEVLVLDKLKKLQDHYYPHHHNTPILKNLHMGRIKTNKQ